MLTSEMDINAHGAVRSVDYIDSEMTIQGVKSSWIN